MVSRAQLFPEELPDRDRSLDYETEPDLSYFYRCPRRSWSQAKHAPQTAKKLGYIGVFFDQRGKSTHNMSKLHIKKKDGSPSPALYNTQ